MKSIDLNLLTITTTKFDLDGITNVVLNYYRAMEKSGMRIDFAVQNEIRNDLTRELESHGSNIYIFKERNKKPLTYISNLSRLINKNKYDIVHAHGNSCTLALEMIAAKKGGAIVRISHSHNTTCKYLTVHKLLRGFFDNNYTHAFACGKEAGQWLYNGKPFETMNNGIDIDKYKYDEEIRKKYRNKYGFKDEKVIGHVGHMTYQKNHGYIIKVFNELYKLDNGCRLMLIGDGVLRNSIEKQVSDLGLSSVVYFIGKSLEVPQLMQAMDIIIMPSIFEGLPLTLVEAQAACLPCYVSDAVSVEAGLTNLVFFLSLNKSPKEWADQINGCKKKNRSQITDKVHEEIEKAGYSIEANANKMRELYFLYLKQRVM